MAYLDSEWLKRSNKLKFFAKYASSIFFIQLLTVNRRNKNKKKKTTYIYRTSSLVWIRHRPSEAMLKTVGGRRFKSCLVRQITS